MRRILLIALAIAGVLSLGGWVVIGASTGTIGHVRAAAEAATDLARAAQQRAGVASASARYDVMDAGGESIAVDVSMRRDAGIEDWTALAVLLRSRLTTGALTGVRQAVHVSGPGAGGGDLRFDDAGDWPDTATLTSWFTRWNRLETVTGVPLRLVHSAKSGSLYGFFVATAPDSRRFVDHVRAAAPLLTGLFVEGSGFSASGAAPHGTASVYRALLRGHAAAPPLATALPTTPVGTVAWGPYGLSVALASPRTQSSPSSADVAVAVALAADARAGQRSVSWTNGTTTASVGWSRCASGERVASAPDRAFAAAVNAARSTGARATGGVCGG